MSSLHDECSPKRHVTSGSDAFMHSLSRGLLQFVYIVSTLLQGFLTFAFVMTILYTLLAMPANLRECKRTQAAARDFIQHNCADGEEMNRLGLMDECDRRFSIRDRRTPVECMWHKALKDVGGCGSQGCLETWRQTAWSYFGLLLTFMFALVVFALLFSRVRRSIASTLDARTSLPSTVKQD